MTKPTRPLYDETGRQVARVSPTAMQHLGQLVVECDRNHLYLADSMAVMRAEVQCPRCHERAPRG